MRKIRAASKSLLIMPHNNPQLLIHNLILKEDDLETLFSMRHAEFALG